MKALLLLLVMSALAGVAWRCFGVPRGGVEHLRVLWYRVVVGLGGRTNGPVTLQKLQTHINRGVRALVVVSVGGEAYPPVSVLVEAAPSDHVLLSVYWDTVTREQGASLARDKWFRSKEPLRMTLRALDDVPAGRPRVIDQSLAATSTRSQSAPTREATLPFTVGVTAPLRSGATEPHVTSQARLNNGRRAPFVMRPPHVTVGRASTCDLVLDSPTVSAIHARFQLMGSRWHLEDLGSLNGTTVNGAELLPETLAPLDDGCVIRFGPSSEYRFEIGSR